MYILVNIYSGKMFGQIICSMLFMNRNDVKYHAYLSEENLILVLLIYTVILVVPLLRKLTIFKITPIRHDSTLSAHSLDQCFHFEKMKFPFLILILTKISFKNIKISFKFPSRIKVKRSTVL